MRKVMLLAAMLAMVLAAAAPVLAQDVNVETGDDVEYNAVCQNLIGAIGDITGVQAATASATAVDDSVAVADVAQEQNISIEQANECLNNIDVNHDGILVHKEILLAKKFVTVSATATVAGKVQYKKTVTATATVKAAPTAKAAVLPDTGGAPLLALGMGVLLVGGGILARRIVR